ncbi:Oxygen-independent coproporphyrinogen-III oxidase [Edwardsiella tarda]|nr:Oxygen-independent coproporphyrinogen-III oxidase [Edwardsiella tarda]
MSTHVGTDYRLGSGPDPKYNYSGPRYTSYPTALEFNEDFNEAAFQRAVVRYPERALSLYVHIPFCHKLCYFCGCNKIVTRQTHKADEYLDKLALEIAARAPLFAGRTVSQLHWGAERRPISTRRRLVA